MTAPDHVSSIIIVDDDPDVRRIIRHPLEKRQIGAIDCGSLAELRDILGKTKPSLIFLDLGLPDAGEGELLDALADAHCNAWIQLISGKSQTDLAELLLAGEECGLRMLPPITKPFKRDAVLAVVDLVGTMMETAR